MSAGSGNVKDVGSDVGPITTVRAAFKGDLPEDQSCFNGFDICGFGPGIHMKK